MRSALACPHRKKEKEKACDSWHSGNKGDGIAPQLNGVRYFSFEELKMYTNNFSESNLIRHDSYGKVYEGYLPNGVVVAIKRAQTESHHGSVEQFKNEIELLSRLHHKNIVRLVGFCFQQGERMLVYEYISKGSLDAILYGKRSMNLEWKQRLQIAFDLARGLAYLHELVNPQMIHGDLNTSNILLDENLNARITSFGFSKLNRDKKEVDVGTVFGTWGYADPVYIEAGKLSEKSDVYGFGAVMLELMIGRRMGDAVDKEGRWTTLKEEVKINIDQYDQEYYGLRDVIDPKIVSQVRNIGCTKFVQLALACLLETSSDRPSIYELMKEIEIILQNY